MPPNTAHPVGQNGDGLAPSPGAPPRQPRHLRPRTPAGYSNARHGYPDADWQPPRLLDSAASDTGARDIPEPVSAYDLCRGHAELRPPVIDGLLRRTEIANLIAAPKLRKTYLAMQLALSVASGQRWLGYFNCRRGDVLYVDCELHPETFRHRLEALARVMRVQGGPLQRVDVLSLRGRLRTIHELQSLFVGPAAHLYSLVILDALYRLVPEDFDENSNGKVTQLYDVVDRYAQFSGAAFVCIHHASKGNQWGKSVTDIGSGAGAQARAVHAHIIMRPHGVADAAVMDFALRSFPPQPSIAAKYEHPVWVRNQELNPADLKTSAPPTKPADRNWTPERFAFEFVNHNPAAKALIVARACDAGLGERQAKRLLELAADRGLIRLRPGKDKRQAAYVLAGKAKNARTAKKSKPGKDI